MAQLLNGASLSEGRAVPQKREAWSEGRNQEATIDYASASKGI